MSVFKTPQIRPKIAVIAEQLKIHFLEMDLPQERFDIVGLDVFRACIRQP
jgi:hypothetical protein